VWDNNSSILKKARHSSWRGKIHGFSKRFNKNSNNLITTKINNRRIIIVYILFLFNLLKGEIWKGAPYLCFKKRKECISTKL